jgi:hypothetical protein
MSRPVFPFAVGDISVLARSLHAQLSQREGVHGHVELLNMLARAGGFKNYQHFRAAHDAKARLDSPPLAPAPIDHAQVEKIAGHFDAEGLLVRWPAKLGHQTQCLWVLWSRLPARQSFAEKAISARLEALHRFGDSALLRRELFDGGWVSRTPDGSDYRRIEREPPPEALALIQHLRLRQTA